MPAVFRMTFGCAILAACGPTASEPAPGLSHDLAIERAASIAGLAYDLHFFLPSIRTEPVTGTVTVRFDLARVDRPVVLDFRAPPNNVRGVRVDGTPASYTMSNGHIVISPRGLRIGPQVVSVDFVSTDVALNRQDTFLYTLFVPDRAATAFPSFDQPDLKGRYRLTLEVPGGWQTIANGSVLSDSTLVEGRREIRFRETAPISTYLFAFAAGEFLVEEAERDGRILTMVHRETDTARVARNRNAIFDLHAGALRWLEQYTGIGYPFDKFAFLAVPSFQFGGMEHPGAVWYRASSLFLDESATQNQLLGRASVIAHETAHMWFGDLVTMRWFDDVWMKEVFANFMAAKIVQPAFPEIDHDLRFFLAHHPTAYAVDRTAGANPIRQKLDNLRDAGSLYGAIIYQKAPIVMRQLERLIGPGTMQAGLRAYLARYRFENATWPDLIAILDSATSEDLGAWSHAWVEASGRPTVRMTSAPGRLTANQEDPTPGRGLHWTQTIDVALGLDGGPERATVRLSGADTTVTVPEGTPRWILPGVDGVSYGAFPLDSTSRTWLLANLPSVRDPLTRSVAWMALWESLLADDVPAPAFVDLALRALPREPDQLILQQVLQLLRTVTWRYLTDTERASLTPQIDRTLWAGLAAAADPSRKGSWFNAVVDIAHDSVSLARIESIWRDRRPVPGLPLSETQYTAMAEALASRFPERAGEILDLQEARITNPDRLARFRVVRRALAAEPSVQDSLFAEFGTVEGRAHESWVLDAMRWLNHPLRAPASERFIAPSLALAEDIQRTGDIFFPLNWLNATLDGHRSGSASETVTAFLREHPNLPPRLRGKLLQAADDLWRAARAVHGWQGEVP